MILLLFIFGFYFLEALHEGLKLRKVRYVPGVIEFIKLALLPVFVFWMLDTTDYDTYFQEGNRWQLPWHFVAPLVGGMVLLRYGMFDFVHNLTAGINIYYIGSSKFYDKILALITKKQNIALFFWLTRVLALLVGVFLLIRL